MKKYILLFVCLFSIFGFYSVNAMENNFYYESEFMKQRRERIEAEAEEKERRKLQKEIEEKEIKEYDKNGIFS